MASLGFARRLGVDMGIWLAACAIFLVGYVVTSSLPATAVLPHVRVVATLWLAVAAFRLLAQALPRRLSDLMSSVVLGLVWTLLLAYYALVIIGLNAWGQIITADLIRTYALQFPALVDALGLSMTAIVAASVIGTAFIVASAYWYIRHFDWAPWLLTAVSPALATVLCVASLAMVAVQTYDFFAAPWTREREPLSLTPFPTEASVVMQTHRIDRVHADLLDRAEDAARVAYTPGTNRNKPNVILIVVDALRPDHLSLLGYARNTTPQLEVIASKANRVMATTIHSSCAESACGLISLASSKYVHQFSNRPITLTEVLKRNGYMVHLILGGDHTHFYGLREAYGHVDTYFDASMAPAYYMNDDQVVVEHTRSLPASDGTPVMFQFHLMSAHPLGKRQRRFRVFTPASNYSTIANRPATGGVANTEAVNYYDNGVCQADNVIADLLEQLKDKGYLSNAVVVVTADHGELLGEHALYSHAKSVYEEVLRVPLILLSFAPETDNHVVLKVAHGSQVDVAPTILQELGIPIPATWTGSPLQRNDRHDLAYYQEGGSLGLYDFRFADHQWKYYVDSRTGKEHMLDLASNPTEQDGLPVVAPAELVHEWRALILPKIRAAVD